MLDVHSHILPGLDDGTKTLEESMEAVRGLQTLGFTDVVATPHFYPERYTPSLASIDQALSELSARMREEGVKINLLRGRECFLDFQLLTAPERESFSFTWNKLRYQLIELPSITVPQVLASYVQGLKQASILPILAHPERYNAVIRNPASAKTYRDMGLRLQVDLANLSSSTHRALRQTAMELFKMDLVDLVASDLHRPSQLEDVREGMEFITREFGREALLRYASLP